MHLGKSEVNKGVVLVGRIMVEGKKQLYVVNGFVFLLYLGLASFANWSLLVGSNLMKWDIADAHFPNAVFLADSLRAGIFPLWNPTMGFGSPHYALLGTPTYYFTTLILALFGYHPRFMGVEYIFHIAVGCFGAYLLINRVIGKQEKPSFVRVCTTLAGGFLYGFSTVFVSNAQHIMIVISAAWIPYVIYFNDRYIQDKKVIHLLLAGLTASLIITGGYPELFVYLFKILVFFNLYHVISADSRICKGVLVALKNVFLIGLFSLLAAAYLIIPFLVSATRVSRLALTHTPPPVLFQFESMMSLFIPGITRNIIPSDTSMSYMYMGLITLLCIPLILKNFKKDVIFYVMLVLFSFYMLFGLRTPIFSFLYRFIPFFGTMRFSPLWRVMIALFAIIVSTKMWLQFFESDEDEGLLVQLITVKVISICTIVLLITLKVLLVLQVGESLDVYRALITQVWLFLLFLVLYGLCFVLKRSKGIRKAGVVAIFTTIVLVEGVTYQFHESPVTITKFAPNDVQFDPAASEVLKGFVGAYRLRNTSVEFREAVRTESGLDSRSIVFGKTLDEAGYLSFNLASTERYLETVNRFIIAQNPAIYFTNNIVSKEHIDFVDWSQDISVPPAQIFVETMDTTYVESPMFRVGNSDYYAMIGLEISEKADGYFLSGEMARGGRRQYRFTKVFLHTDNSKVDIVVSYTHEGEVLDSHRGMFVVNRDLEVPYIEIFYPNHDREYSGLKLASSCDFHIEGAMFHIAQRMNQADHIVVDSFTPNKIQITVDAPETGYLTILQNHYPGWRAYVDGEPSEILLVNETFMGLLLNEGISHVVLRFVPFDFYVGLLISGLYMVILMAFVLKRLKDLKFCRKTEQ